MKTFARYAKERIDRLGKSQKALAEELGVSPAYISQLLTGRKNPPDLARPKNRSQLRAWSDTLGVAEDELLDLIRYELHRVPPRPEPRFLRMRKLLLERLGRNETELADEIRSLALHPAESRAIHALIQVYLVSQEEWSDTTAFAVNRFKEFCYRAKGDRRFVEEILASFFEDLPFTWDWDAEANDLRLVPQVAEIRQAMERIEQVLSDVQDLTFGRTVPVVGHVSAGEGFEYTDGGYSVGDGFEYVLLPPGVDPALSGTLYCVRVRGDSLRELFGDGALLFIKPESWEEIKDGDLVIFKRRDDNKAYVKKVEFSGENLILKSKNPLYKDIVLHKNELMLLERVMAVVF
ncbi:MAG: S24 family peptidase [Desulfomonilaceae bacterium]|nr:S24 family peptidase [Desulfomonilaceae bacterium]